MSEIVDPRDEPGWAEDVERKCRNMPQDTCYLCLDSHAERGLARYCACPVLAHEACIGELFLDAKTPKCQRCYTPVLIDWTFREAEKPCAHQTWYLLKRQRRATQLWRKQLEHHLGTEATTALYWVLIITSALVIGLFSSGCTSPVDKFGDLGCLAIGLFLFLTGMIFCSRESFSLWVDILWFGVVLLIVYLPACDADWRDGRGGFWASWIWMEIFARSLESVLHLIVCLSAPLEMMAKVAIYQPPVPLPSPPPHPTVVATAA